MQMLVNVSAYEGGKRFDDIAPADISDLLGSPQTFVWVGLSEPAAELLALPGSQRLQRMHRNHERNSVVQLR